jgi:hypothetical protein
MSYALLVLPDRDDIDIDVLKRIEQLVRDGATVVGPKPRRSNGLTGYPERDVEVQGLANRLWGPCDGKTVFEHQHGRGRIVWGPSLREVLEQQGIGPDCSFTCPQEDAELDFIHRRTQDADIYFVRNKQKRWERFEASFRSGDKAPELWDPGTGNIATEYVYRKTETGAVVPLELPPLGSVFVVFRDRPSAGGLDLQAHPKSKGVTAARVESWDGRQAELTTFASGRYVIETNDGRKSTCNVALPRPRVVADPWDVTFADEWGATWSKRFDELVSWTACEEEKIRHFAGTATYEKSFGVPGSWLQDEGRLLLDLGNLWAVAEVEVNGKPLGVLWKPPLVVDITSVARPGKNQLEIKVANAWSNRLVGDAKLPEGQRQTRTNVLHNNGKLWAGEPLLESGLLGPVRLIPGTTRTVVLE